jgi:hypothetical protein
LEATQNYIRSDILRAREARNRADQTFSGSTVVITEQDDPKSFAEFRKTGKLVFRISPNIQLFGLTRR